MGTASGMIQVDSEIAEAYNTAPPEVQKRIQELIALWLEHRPPRSWDDLDEVENAELVEAIKYSEQVDGDNFIPLADFLDDEKERLGS
ncbi:MAG: hypothetical protein HQK60_20510 [Deltaproteobacteria bacterium]|nr:hypothetical protein [Deltaproteobacteria bacterium]